MDTQGKAQLLANVQYIKNSIQENFPFCEEIPAHTTGEEIYNATATFFDEEELELSNCKSVCTDGAPSMVGKYNAFWLKLGKRIQM